MAQHLSRRDLLRGMAASSAAFALGGRPTWADEPRSANEKLNIGVIGTSGRALGNISGV